MIPDLYGGKERAKEPPRQGRERALCLALDTGVSASGSRKEGPSHPVHHR